MRDLAGVAPARSGALSRNSAAVARLARSSVAHGSARVRAEVVAAVLGQSWLWAARSLFGGGGVGQRLGIQAGAQAHDVPFRWQSLRFQRLKHRAPDSSREAAGPHVDGSPGQGLGWS